MSRRLFADRSLRSPMPIVNKRLLGRGVLALIAGTGARAGLAGTTSVAPTATPTTAPEPSPSGTQPTVDSRARLAIDLPYEGFLLNGSGATPLASARLQADRDATGYRIVLTVNSILADLTYESRGDVDPYGLVPRQFIDRRKVAFRSPRERTVHYAYTDDPGLVNQIRDDHLQVPPHTQDRLSLMLQMMQMGRADAQFLRDGHSVQIPFASTSRVAPSRWQISGPEPVAADTADAARAGRPPGFRISRVADSENTIDVSFWLAVTPDHRPLALQFSESGRSLRFVARR